ncbi:MAG: ECF-type sigma factor [Pseudomonadota bacterium]
MADATALLNQWNSGDDSARAALIEAVYAELKDIAARHLAAEWSSRELQPSALVHECYLRLIDIDRLQWQGRAHFLSMAARIMRQILVDDARRRGAEKRGSGRQITLRTVHPDPDQLTTTALAVHEALERLATIDPDRAHLVELRYFGGLTIAETAEQLEVSPATVKRSWDVARGWLFRELNKDAP